MISVLLQCVTSIASYGLGGFSAEFLHSFFSQKKILQGPRTESLIHKKKNSDKNKVMRRLDNSPSIDELVEDHFRSQVSQVLYLLFFQ